MKDNADVSLKGDVRVYGIMVFLKAGFRDFDQNHFGIWYFKPFTVTVKCKFYQQESGI